MDVRSATLLPSMKAALTRVGQDGLKQVIADGTNKRGKVIVARRNGNKPQLARASGEYGSSQMSRS